MKHRKWTKCEYEWVKCEVTGDLVPVATASWRADEVIFPRFSLYMSIDPMVKKLTGHRFIWFRKGETRCIYRFQIVSFIAQIRIFRDPLRSA